MLGRLLKKLFRRKGAGREATTSRPVSPPPPVVASPAVTPMAAPPPPPPPPAPMSPVSQPAAEAPTVTSEATPTPSTPAPAAEELDGVDADQTRVRLVLKDGTTATPGLDAESEERLRYILDNIVPPPDGPAT